MGLMRSVRIRGRAVWFALIALVALSVVSPAAPAAAASNQPAATSSFALNFNSLPSAQGWTYFQGGSTPEASVFSVTGTSLIQDTIGTGLGNPNYAMFGVVDGTQPFQLTVRARILAYEGTQPFGFFFAVRTASPNQDYAIGFTPSRVADDNGNGVAVDTTIFHTYVLRATPGGPYTLDIDGKFALGGTFDTNGGALDAVQFGDGANLGPTNARAEVTQLQFSQGPPCTSPPDAPQNVQDTAVDVTDNSGAGQVSVSWDAPGPTCDPVDHYDIVTVDAQGNPSQTMGTAPASDTSKVINGLNLCRFYRFGVVAVGTDSKQSPVASPSSPAFTTGLPNASPPVVTILLQGVSTSLPGSSWNPLNTEYCSSPDGTPDNIGQQQNPALASLAANWLNKNDKGNPDYASPGAGSNLIDSVASTGGLVLPFSYNGATLSVLAASPTFTVQSYSATDVANSLPMPEAGTLNTEISTINAVWPNAKIIVVGHSNGGLIAQQWWWLYGRTFPQGVVQVFSLDSPINGVYAGTFCISHKPADIAKCLAELAVTPVSHKLLANYGTLWRNQADNDSAYLNADQQNHLYTPIVTDGDPLFDAADSGAGIPQNGGCDFSTQGTNIGWGSQGLLTGCSLASVDVVEVACDGASLCDDGTSFPFKMPSDRWVHSWVKNSSLTIGSVMSYVPS